MPHHLRLLRRASALLALTLFASSLLAAETPKQNFNLPGGDAETTLREFTKQAKVQLVFDSQKVAGVQTAAVKGEATPREALDQMFAGTGLVAEQDKTSGAFTVRKETPAEAKNGSSRPGSSDRAASDKIEGTIKLETFEVMGTKLLNMDKPRSRNDAQPYVVFDRTKIEQSGASSIEDFLKTRLTMNTVGATNSQTGPTFPGNSSRINLRGLGENQTLILVDGRRMPNVFTGLNTLGQPDLNGIPLAAVERIEVLPTTASGIYGGGATGGVINVILKRNYAGVETQVTYDNSFASDSSIRRADISAGFTIEGGKTSILISASYADQNALSVWDRDFARRYRQTYLLNNNSNYRVLDNLGFSPPIGQTPNILSADASNLVLKSGVALNAPITFVPLGYKGIASDQGAALAANAGKYNLEWGNSQTGPGGGLASLLNGPTVASVAMTLRRQFGQRLEAFVDLGAANNTGHFPYSVAGNFGYTLPSTASTNPFNQSIIVTLPIQTDLEVYSSTRSRRISGGLIAKLSADWKAEIDYVWNSSQTQFKYPLGETAAFRNAVSSGTVEVLRDPTLFPIDQSLFAPTFATSASPNRDTLEDATLRVAGPVSIAHLPRFIVSALAEHRNENISEGLVLQDQGTSILTRLTPERSQSVDSAYLETIIPILGNVGANSNRSKLELQVAARYDRYTTNGTTGILNNPTSSTVIVRATNKIDSIDPTLSLRYQPLEDLTLRISYGTGFLPPSVQQIAQSLATTTNVRDPKRGNTATPIPVGSYATGGNPNLKPENSTSFSLGTILTPRVLPGLRLSVDYVKTKKADNISTFPGGAQAIVNNEALFPSRITRGPKLATDPADWAGPIVFLDNTLLNLSTAEIEAFDVQADYSSKVAGGTIDFFAAATWQTHYKTQLTSASAFVENVGAGSANPLKLKANFGTTWSIASWTLGWTARYFDSYWVNGLHTVDVSQGGSKISSQLYHDVFITYRIRSTDTSGPAVLRVLSGTQISFGIRNIFDKAPPYDSTNTDFAYYSRFGDPRMQSYYVTLKHEF